ncbi:MAG TPA: hypothetical protein VJ727_05460 [Rhodanobacteraceae bacterium]|nr:hypothetical protein [Rhodanobacteraceae bacterium]
MRLRNPKLQLFAFATLVLCEIQATAAVSVPAFNQFPVKEHFRGRAARPNLSSPRAHLYRTVLRDAAKNGPNFAGHFIIALWGCGSACASWAMINARTGAVWFAPFTVSAPPCKDSPAFCNQSIDFELDSNLIVVTGSRNETGAGRYFYRWDDGRLSLIDKIEGTQKP